MYSFLVFVFLIFWKEVNDKTALTILQNSPLKKENPQTNYNRES